MKKIIFLICLVTLGACSPQADKLYAPAVTNYDKVEEDPNAQYFDPQTDILFVVDSSASMGEHQQLLATNVDKFTSVFTKNSVLNYNIGVITTDMDCGYGSTTACLGRLVGTTRVVTKATLNADRVLASNILVGTNGSGTEMLFDPLVAALNPSNLAGWNTGFYRTDASLAVIFITDAEDQSDKMDAISTYNFLLKLKSGNASKILAYGVIVPSSVSNCPRDENTLPFRIEEFLRLFKNVGNNVLNLCDPNYSQRLIDLAKDIVNKTGGILYLNRIPNLDSLRVMYGTVELPNNPQTGWSYDPKKNAVILGEKIDWSVQPSGTKVKVRYDAAI